MGEHLGRILFPGFPILMVAALWCYADAKRVEDDEREAHSRMLPSTIDFKPITDWDEIAGTPPPAAAVRPPPKPAVAAARPPAEPQRPARSPGSAVTAAPVGYSGVDVGWAYPE